MKKRSVFYSLLVLAFFSAACSSKPEHHEGHHTEGADSTIAAENWNEMDEFHMIMAESFHPFKDSANLAPAKAKAVEMAAAAQKWLAAPLPEKVNNDETKEKLERLSQGTIAFAETVKSGEDNVIGQDLTKLHNVFHELQESWYAGGHGNHHEHH